MPTERPFRILGVQQIAVGAPDRAPLRLFWVELLGLEHVKSNPQRGGERRRGRARARHRTARGRGGSHAARGSFGASAGAGAGAQPRGDCGVDDLRAAVRWLTEAGVRFAPGGIRLGASGHDVCFVHPKGNEEFPIGGQGVLVELVQAPRTVIEGFDGQST